LEAPSILEALEMYRETPHGFLEEKAREELVKMGYKVIRREEASD